MNYTPVIGIGDRLARPKFFGLVQHEGVLVGYDTVLTNTPGKGEHIASLQDFAAGQRITVRPTGADPASVVARARRILARPRRYDPIARNCQHTVNESVYGVAKSPSVGFAGVVGVCLLCFALLRN